MTLAITLPPLPVRDVLDRPDAVNQMEAWLQESLKEYKTTLDSFEESYNEICRFVDDSEELPAVSDALASLLDQQWRMAEQHIRSLWDNGCKMMTMDQRHLAKWQQAPHLPIREQFLTAINSEIERLAELMRTMAVVWEELELETPEEIYEAVWTIRVSPQAYLRAMWNLFWSSIRHPLSDTVIELKTGRVLTAG